MSRFKIGDYVKINVFCIGDDVPKRDNGELESLYELVIVAATDDAAGSTWSYAPFSFIAKNPKTGRLMRFYDEEAILIWRPGAGTVDRYKEGYDAGLNDAWVAARKVVLSEEEGGLDCTDLDQIFGNFNPVSVINDYSAEQVIQKLKEYEREQKDKEIEDRIRHATEGVPTDKLAQIIDDIIQERRYMEERKMNGTVQEEEKE